jgi:peptidoglycan/LPS O-acetylase OafA/YrhL
MEPTKNGARFRELDVLRGVASLAVLAYHYSRHGSRYFSGYPFKFLYGRYGVQLFFVISGFVIYFTLERSRTLRDFAFSRFSRLYPAYWATLLIALITSTLVLHEHPWWPGYAINATMLQEFVGVGDLDAVFWTLAVELVFYALMSLVFVAGLLGQIVPLALLWLVAAVFWSHETGFAGDSFTSVQQSYFILPCAPYFIAGIMFHLIRSRGLRRSYVGMIALAWLCIAFLNGFPQAWVAALIFGGVALAISGRLKFLITPVTLWLGAISYPLYLVHRDLGYYLLFWFDRHQVPHLLAFALTLAAALALAHLVSVAVERPAMHVLRNWYHRRSERADVAIREA